MPLTTIKGHNVTFPATQVPDAGTNVLDDYEEGSWTPVIGSADSSESGQVYSVQVGRYVKVGKLVHVQGYAILTTKGTINGTTAAYKGLPFPVENVNQCFASMTVGYASGLAASTYYSLSALAVFNTSLIYLYKVISLGSAHLNVVPADITNTTAIAVSGYYRTTN